MPQAFHDGTIKSLAYHLNTSQLGKTKLILDVEEGNSEALHFYEKWHFSSAGTKPFLPTTQRYLRMEKVVDDNDA